jgi:hypothetical protein
MRKTSKSIKSGDVVEMSKEEYEHNCDCWHFGRWCMARGVLRGQTNHLTFEEALKIDREEARYFADKLKIDELSKCFV